MSTDDESRWQIEDTEAFSAITSGGGDNGASETETSLSTGVLAGLGAIAAEVERRGWSVTPIYLDRVFRMYSTESGGGLTLEQFCQLMKVVRTRVSDITAQGSAGGGGSSPRAAVGLPNRVPAEGSNSNDAGTPLSPASSESGQLVGGGGGDAAQAIDQVESPIRALQQLQALSIKNILLLKGRALSTLLYVLVPSLVVLAMWGLGQVATPTVYVST